MREKKRYLLYKIEGQKLDEKTLRSALRKSVNVFVGEHGSSQANVKLMEFDAGKQEFLIRSSLAMVENVIASLAFQTALNNSPIAFRLQGMSGAVKHVWKNTK